MSAEVKNDIGIGKRQGMTYTLSFLRKSTTKVTRLRKSARYFDFAWSGKESELIIRCDRNFILIKSSDIIQDVSIKLYCLIPRYCHYCVAVIL